MEKTAKTKKMKPLKVKASPIEEMVAALNRAVKEANTIAEDLRGLPMQDGISRIYVSFAVNEYGAIIKAPVVKRVRYY